MRVAMTETGHRDPAGKIEKFPTVGGVKIEAFAPFDGDIPPTVGRHNGWYHGSLLRDFSGTISENAGFIVVAGAPCTQLSRAFPNAGSRCRDCLSSPSPRTPRHLRGFPRFRQRNSAAALGSPTAHPRMAGPRTRQGVYQR